MFVFSDGILHVTCLELTTNSSQDDLIESSQQSTEDVWNVVVACVHLCMLLYCIMHCVLLCKSKQLLCVQLHICTFFEWCKKCCEIFLLKSASCILNTLMSNMVNNILWFFLWLIVDPWYYLSAQWVSDCWVLELSAFCEKVSDEVVRKIPVVLLVIFTETHPKFFDKSCSEMRISWRRALLRYRYRTSL